MDDRLEDIDRTGRGAATPSGAPDRAADELAPSEIRLFVYGTFLTGEANHACLRRARFLRVDRTLPEYDLFDLGGFPALVTGGDCVIEGEVWVVDRDLLLSLDEFEDAPEFYRRVEVRLDGGPAQAYLLPRGSACAFPRIDCGDWRRRDGARASEA